MTNEETKHKTIIKQTEKISTRFYDCFKKFTIFAARFAKIIRTAFFKRLTNGEIAQLARAQHS